VREVYDDPHVSLADEVEEIAKLGSWRLDLATGELHWSREMYEIFGVDPDAGDLDLAAITESAIHPDDRAALRAVNRAVLKDGIPRPMEYRILLPDWSVRWVDARGRQELGEDGESVALVGFVQDVTERKLLELDLAEREERLKSVVDNAPFGSHVYQLTSDDRLVFIGYNHRSAEMLGVDHAELIGKTLEEAFPGNAGAETAEKYREVAREGTTWESEQYAYDDGAIAGVFQIIAFSIGGRRVCVFFRDITEKAKLEHELHESEMRLVHAVEETPFPVLLHTDDGEIVRVNRAWCEITGMDAEGFAAREAWDDFIGSENMRRARSAIQALSGEVSRVEHGRYDMNTPDGRQHVIEVFSAVVGSLPGSRRLLMTVGHDVTERTLQERKLERMSRAIRALGLCNSALVRAESEDVLLERVCQILVEDCGYLIAWIGYAQDMEAKRIIPVKSRGASAGFFESLNLSWAEDADAGCVAGSAVVTREIAIVRDARDEPVDSDSGAPRAKAGFPLSDEHGEVFGALVAVSLDPNAFDKDEVALLAEMSEDLAFGICAIRARHVRDAAQESLAHVNQRLVRTLVSLTETIGRITETRDPMTSGHQTRVAAVARAIAVEMGLSASTIDAVEVAGLVHDVGKLGVPTEILTRPRRLNPVEWAIVKEHSEVGRALLEDIDFGWPITDYVLQHHERLDGSGYPQGLVGDEIALEARIVAVADVVEAMSSHRPYRPSWGVEAAVAEVVDHPELYDASVAAACARLHLAGKLDL
jgi:PAS domain S-box-containing protein